MRISDVTIETLLQKAGKATPEQIDELKKSAERSRRPLQTLAIQNKLIGEAQLTKLFASIDHTPPARGSLPVASAGGE